MILSGVIERMRQARPRVQAAAPRGEVRRYPDDVDTGDEVRRRDFAVWVLGTVAVGELLAIFALIAVIAGMVPLKEKVPFLVFPSPKSDQLIRVEPMVRGATGMELTMQIFVREYIVARHSILQNSRVMKERWDKDGSVDLRSDEKVYAEFVEEVRPLIKVASERRITREVVLVGDPLRLTDGYYQQDFDLVDTEAGTQRVESRQQFRANVGLTLRTRQVRYDQRYINPAGITVVEYAVVRRQDSPAGTP